MGRGSRRMLADVMLEVMFELILLVKRLRQPLRVSLYAAAIRTVSTQSLTSSVGSNQGGDVRLVASS